MEEVRKTRRINGGAGYQWSLEVGEVGCVSVVASFLAKTLYCTTKDPNLGAPRVP